MKLFEQTLRSSTDPDPRKRSGGSRKGMSMHSVFYIIGVVVVVVVILSLLGVV